MKIILERQKCIGCGSCQTLCPKYWQIDEEGKAKLLGAKQGSSAEIFEREVAEIECNKEAADSCPVQCIKIEN